MTSVIEVLRHKRQQAFQGSLPAASLPVGSSESLAACLTSRRQVRAGAVTLQTGGHAAEDAEQQLLR